MDYALAHKALPSTPERMHLTELAENYANVAYWVRRPVARDGKVVCFFQGAAKFEARYSTLGFNDAAALDDGNMWPASFALVELSEAEEARIAELVRRAVG